MLKTMPQNVKEYFDHGPFQLLKLIPNDDFTLTLYYSDDSVRLYDLSERLTGVFEILKDINKFKSVFKDEYGGIAWDINPEVDSSIHWNNRIDICPDAAYMDSTIIE